MLLALALVLLTPLKTVEPYTLLVDRQTGFVQAVDPLEPQRISGDAALTQSFLVQYVIARESFDIDSVQSSYRKVSLWSADSARALCCDDAGHEPSKPADPLSALDSDRYGGQERVSNDKRQGHGPVRNPPF